MPIFLIKGINMTVKGKKPSEVILVVVAVLRFGDEFLLAIRHHEQHQGGKLEFIGGKIEQNETVQMALVREVREELGLDVSDNQKQYMGQIHHDYGDKAVLLDVYQVILTQVQYDAFYQKTVGLDNQVLLWLDKDALLDSVERFPDANRQILAWLGEMK